MSTGYIPKIDTARATAAATKCDLASDIVLRNDLKITSGDIDEEAVVVLVVVEILAAPPPRGKVVAAATAVVLTPLPMMSGERFIGWKV